jgi:hypothetical protein
VGRVARSPVLPDLERVDAGDQGQELALLPTDTGVRGVDGMDEPVALFAVEHAFDATWTQVTRL